METREMERMLKALANKRRLAILKFLNRAGEATVGTIAEKIKLSFKATSRHLSVLASADTLAKEQRSVEVYYRIDERVHKIVRDIIALL